MKYLMPDNDGTRFNVVIHASLGLATILAVTNLVMGMFKVSNNAGQIAALLAPARLPDTAIAIASTNNAARTNAGTVDTTVRPAADEIPLRPQVTSEKSKSPS